MCLDETLITTNNYCTDKMVRSVTDSKDAFIKLLCHSTQNTGIEYFNPKVKCYSCVANSTTKVLTNFTNNTLNEVYHHSVQFVQFEIKMKNTNNLPFIHTCS